MRSLAILALLLMLAACPRPRPVEPEPSALEQDKRSLVLPVSDQALPEIAAALSRLSDAAASGDEDAAWTRLHYLVDLFDDARFRQDPSSLTLLHQALHHDENLSIRGPEATDRVLAALIEEVNDLFALDRMHPYVPHARTLLDFDARPPLSRVGLFTRMAELESMARNDGPLAANARLRMIGYCWRALDDMASTKYARRHEVLSHCLYPLYRTDPAPYFARLPEDRPPTPRWRDIVAELETLAVRVADSDGRMALAGRAMVERVRETAKVRADDMPSIPELETMNLARAKRVPLYDWTPLFVASSGDDLMTKLSDRDALTKVIAGDGRQTVTVVLGQDASAQVLLVAGPVLAAAGAETLELGVVTEQFLKVPRGDYWHDRLDHNTATRLGVIPISLVPLNGQPKLRSEAWDPSRATLDLHLVVTPDTWTLVAPTGIVAKIEASSKEHATATLQGIFAWLYAAFPEEDAVRLVPGSGATIGQLIAALEAARHDAQGRELMAIVGLAENAPNPVQNTLPDRIERRSKAAVEIEPSELAVRGSVVRHCYQTVLDKRPKARGTFRLELHGAEVVVVSGPKDPDIRACLSVGLAPLMKEKNMASARVRLLAE